MFKQYIKAKLSSVLDFFMDIFYFLKMDIIVDYYEIIGEIMIPYMKPFKTIIINTIMDSFILESIGLLLILRYLIYSQRVIGLIYWSTLYYYIRPTFFCNIFALSIPPQTISYTLNKIKGTFLGFLFISLYCDNKSFNTILDCYMFGEIHLILSFYTIITIPFEIFYCYMTDTKSSIKDQDMLRFQIACCIMMMSKWNHFFLILLCFSLIIDFIIHRDVYPLSRTTIKEQQYIKVQKRRNSSTL
jgi:hypothetical protein